MYLEVTEARLTRSVLFIPKVKKFPTATANERVGGGRCKQVKPIKTNRVAPDDVDSKPYTNPTNIFILPSPDVQMRMCTFRSLAPLIWYRNNPTANGSGGRALRKGGNFPPQPEVHHHGTALRRIRRQHARVAGEARQNRDTSIAGAPNCGRSLK